MSYHYELPNYTLDSSGDTIELWGRDQSLAPNGTFAPGRGLRMEDWWDIAAADLTDFLDICGGITEPWVTGNFSRLIPLRNKFYPISLCTSADFKFYTLERASGVLSKDRARIRVTYEAPSYPVAGADAFISYERHPGQRYIPLPGAAAGAGAFSEPPIKREVTEHLYITYHHLASDPTAAFNAYKGYANSDTWRGKAAGTLIFRGMRIVPEAIIGGFSTYKGIGHFEESIFGWNNWINAEGDITSVTYDGGTAPAPLTSFTTLFGA